MLPVGADEPHLHSICGTSALTPQSDTTPHFYRTHFHCNHLFRPTGPPTRTETSRGSHVEMADLDAGVVELDALSRILPLPYRLATVLVLGIWLWGVNLQVLHDHGIVS